jgi:hypothetical protein
MLCAITFLLVHPRQLSKVTLPSSAVDIVGPLKKASCRARELLLLFIDFDFQSFTEGPLKILTDALSLLMLLLLIAIATTLTIGVDDSTYVSRHGICLDDMFRAPTKARLVNG